MSARHFTETIIDSKTFRIPSSGQGDPRTAEFEGLTQLETDIHTNAERERSARLLEAITLDIDTTTEREYRRLSARAARGTINTMEALEGKLDKASTTAGSFVRNTKLTRNLSDKKTELAARTVEAGVKSGVHLAIGLTALGLTVATGPGTAIIAGAFAARTGARVSKGLHKANQTKSGRLEKLTTDSDHKGMKFLVGAANVAQLPERWASNKVLGRNAETASDKRRLVAHTVGAVASGIAMFGVGRWLLRPAVATAEHVLAKGYKALDNQIIGTAEAKEIAPATPETGGSITLTDQQQDKLLAAIDKQRDAYTNNPSSAGNDEALAKLNKEEGLVRSGTITSEQLNDLGIDPKTLGITAPAPATPATGGSGGSAASKFDSVKDWNQNEKNIHGRQSSEGFYDGTERTSAKADAHVLHKVENNPTLMAEVLEVRESGNDNFSVTDVNHDAASYINGAQSGEYNATGVKAVHTLEHSWKNGEPGKILSDNQAQKLLESHNLINHGTHGNKVFAAGAFDYRPELGDKIYAKELGNGKTVFFKINDEHPSRDCLNCLTLEKKPPVVETPATPVAPTQPKIPNHPQPGMHQTPHKNVPHKPHIHTPHTPHTPEQPPVTTTPPPEQPPVTPPETTPPPVTPPPETPPELTPKGPTAGAYGSTPGVSDGLGNNGEIHGPGTLKPATPPPNTYTPPPAPVTPEIPRPQAPPVVETPAPTPEAPGTTIPDPF
jgi:hypothetical protein